MPPRSPRLSRAGSRRWPRARAALAGQADVDEVQRRSDVMLERVRAAESGATARIERVRADCALLARLEELRVVDERSDSEDDELERDRKYAQAFREAGLDLEALGETGFAREARSHGIEIELAAALDCWADVRYAACRRDGADALRRVA